MKAFVRAGVLLAVFGAAGMVFAGDVKKGEAIFAKKCAVCHKKDGSGSKMAPALNKKFDAKKYKATLDGAKHKGKVKGAEVDDVLSFVETLSKKK